MTDFKGMLRSRAVWAGIVGFVAVVLDMFGAPLADGFDQGQTVDAILKLVEASSFIASIVFRVIATKRIA